MAAIEAFFEDIDRAWLPEAAGRVPLRILGASALLIQFGYDRGTKDSDVLETLELTDTTKRALIALAGPGTKLHTQHRLYIELVPNGLPFLRQGARWNGLDALNARLKHLSVHALDAVDVVVSKLKRFNASDRDDIEAMIDGGLVKHEEIVACFREAVDVFECDARAEDLPDYVDSLHTVERDMFGVAESEIELPNWIG